MIPFYSEFEAVKQFQDISVAFNTCTYLLAYIANDIIFSLLAALFVAEKNKRYFNWHVV